MRRAVVDTNLLSLALRDLRDDKRTPLRASFEAYLAEHGGLHLSVLVLYEIRRGLPRKGDRRISALLDQLVRMSQVLYFDTSEISVWPFAAKLWVELQQAGKPMGDFDLLIAATAQAYQMAVATADCGFDNLGERVPIERWDAVQPAADPT